MKTLRHPACTRAFTLLEVVIVLAITALVLSAVYSLAQGTLTLADDVRRAERRDARTQAFTTFCEHLLAELSANALLNISTTEEHGQYLTRLELEHVRSPFDATPDCRVTLHTQAQTGGGLSLILTCKTEAGESSVMLFENLVQCEWSVFHPNTRQWAASWSEESPAAHPKLVKLVMRQAVGDVHEQVFWIAPAEAVTQKMHQEESRRSEAKTGG